MFYVKNIQYIKDLFVLLLQRYIKFYAAPHIPRNSFQAPLLLCKKESHVDILLLLSHWLSARNLPTC